MNERLPQPYGKWIDRHQSVAFRFEGKDYTGYAGDRISTALWASGLRVLGRSFKYHRPRGVWSLADIDSNVLVEYDTETNIRGDVAAVSEGMDVRAVNTAGGVAKDRRRFLDYLSAFTPVGFYYKAFHTPRRLFPFYEERIRNLAGLGEVNTEKPHRYTIKDYAFCDVLVVGAGPAGLSAALAAAEAGAKVMLVDDGPHPGGTLSYQHEADTESAAIFEGLQTKLTSQENIEYRRETTAVSHDADNWIALMDAKRLTKLRAGAVIAATGCYEQPAVFRNNDLPGVMLGSAAQRLIHLYAVKPFDRAVALVANTDGYRALLDLLEAGIGVAAVADLRAGGEPTELARQVADKGVHVENGWTVYEALPASRKAGVSGAVLCALDNSGAPRSETAKTVSCNGVLISVGWAPADTMLRQRGTRMDYDAGIEQFVPAALPPGIFTAGRVNGVYDLQAQMQDGAGAGREAAAYLGLNSDGTPPRPERSGPPASHPYPIISHPRGKNFVDLDEDLQVKDLLNAIQEGFDHIELLKRYTTVGMGPSQGKHSNLGALRILDRARGEGLDGKQMTTARPYVTPTPLSHLAGRIFTPRRRAPAHFWHEREMSKLMYAGVWYRPEYYRMDGSSREECIYREAKNVRENVGLIDLGTLGKLEVIGPDAVAFLERMYTGKFAKLKPRMCRYSVMCDESGIIIDDGITARVAEDRFYVSATTGGAEGVFREMKRWALLWGMGVAIVNATDHYGAMNIAGPLSREVLAKVTDIDLNPDEFPYMGFREGLVAGVPARVSRVGFVSGLGYEIHPVADGTAHVWQALMDAGEAQGIRAFGVEAQRLLRLEMGHIIIGKDTDALTNPYHVGLNWALKMDKPFFVGQRSLQILNGHELDRQLVGFVMEKGHDGPIPEDCHQIIDKGDIAGRVTSVGKSPVLDKIIGMAFVRPDLSHPGTGLSIRVTDGTIVHANVTPLPFFEADTSV